MKNLNPSVPGTPKIGRFEVQSMIMRVLEQQKLSGFRLRYGAPKFFHFKEQINLISETTAPDWSVSSHRFSENFDNFLFESKF